jgi:hypothetical protein
MIILYVGVPCSAMRMLLQEHGQIHSYAIDADSEGLVRKVRREPKMKEFARSVLGYSAIKDLPWLPDKVFREDSTTQRRIGGDFRFVAKVHHTSPEPRHLARKSQWRAKTSRLEHAISGNPAVSEFLMRWPWPEQRTSLTSHLGAKRMQLAGRVRTNLASRTML